MWCHHDANSARRLARRDKGEEVDEAEEPDNSAPDAYADNTHARRPQRYDNGNSISFLPLLMAMVNQLIERTASSRPLPPQEVTRSCISRLYLHYASILWMRVTMTKTKRTTTTLTLLSHEDRLAPSDPHTSVVIDTRGLMNRHPINPSHVLQSPPGTPTATLPPATALPHYVLRTMILHPSTSLRRCMIIIFMGQCTLLHQRVPHLC
jgi:hypothetical protein